MKIILVFSLSNLNILTSWLSKEVLLKRVFWFLHELKIRDTRTSSFSFFCFLNHIEKPFCIILFGRNKRIFEILSHGLICRIEVESIHESYAPVLSEKFAYCFICHGWKGVSLVLHEFKLLLSSHNIRRFRMLNGLSNVLYCETEGIHDIHILWRTFIFIFYFLNMCSEQVQYILLSTILNTLHLLCSVQALFSRTEGPKGEAGATR
jgi:hypothetical protein